MADIEYEMTDTDCGLISAVKGLMEIMISKKVTTPDSLTRMFREMEAGFLHKKMPGAVAVMDMLAEFAANPERAAQREAARKLLGEPPKGSA